MKLMKTLMITGALLVSTQAAHATDVNKDDSGRLSTIVKYDDLDLNRDAGAARLHNRIWAATKQVCTQPSAIRLKALGAYEACRSQALSEAVADINNPNLNQLHAMRTNKSAPGAKVAALR